MDELCYELYCGNVQEITFSMCNNERLGLNNLRRKFANRQLSKICCALSQSTSLKKVSIGPLIAFRYPHMMNIILLSIAQSPVNSVESLSLSLSPTRIAAYECELKLLLSRLDSLHSLEISVQQDVESESTASTTCRMPSRSKLEHEDTTSMILNEMVLPHLHRIKVLRLSRCGVRDEHLITLQRHMERNNLKLEELSLAGNKKITEYGFQALCFIKTRYLDLRECEISESCLQIMVTNIQQDASCFLEDIVISCKFHLVRSGSLHDFLTLVRSTTVLLTTN